MGLVIVLFQEDCFIVDSDNHCCFRMMGGVWPFSTVRSEQLQFKAIINNFDYDVTYSFKNCHPLVFVLEIVCFDTAVET